MKVCIAEKPSVGREIAKILGAATTRGGYMEGNGYFVTWVFGHLCELKEPHDYTPFWKQWVLHALPMIPDKFGIKLKKDKGVENQFNIIKGLIEQSDEVINCGDAGQEGELIQRWVLHHTGLKRPVKRLWISSLTEQAIRDGFKNLKESNDFDKLYAAGSARTIGDWLLGMNATRAYTLRYAQQKQVLSIGRVQTPTLALIVNRQAEIDNFKPENYWELKTDYRGAIFSYAKGKLSSAQEAAQILESIKNQDFEITDFQQKEGYEAPPRLFDLTSLQVDCNSKYGFSADETLKLIQSLYEKKLTTYPRVDTTYLSDDIYPKIGDTLKGLTPYANLVNPLLQEPIRKTKKVFDNSKVTDHHAIIPTGFAPGSDLPRNEKLVFDLIARRFIAAFYPDSKISTTSVNGKSADADFKCTGKQIIEEAWRVCFPKKETDDSEKSKDEEQSLPDFEIGEKGTHKPKIAEKKTQPPKQYTEATLLRAMETAGKNSEDEEVRRLMKENGIGRPSTRAAIIETLFRRRYIRKEKKNLVPTLTGIQLIGLIKDELLKSVELTGLWEKKLRMIERGEYSTEDFMKEMRDMVCQTVKKVVDDREFFQVAYGDNKKKKKSVVEKIDLTCPKCGKPILTGKTAWGCSGYKEGCKILVPFEYMGKSISKSMAEKLFTKKECDIKGIVKDEVKQDGKLIFNADYQLEFIKSEQKKVTIEDLKCPLCGKPIITGKTAWGCSGYKEGCTFKIPFEFMHKKLTITHLEALCINKQTGKISGFTDEQGQKKAGKLVVTSTGNISIK